jgi:diguanylate cyclase
MQQTRNLDAVPNTDIFPNTEELIDPVDVVEPETSPSIVQPTSLLEQPDAQEEFALDARPAALMRRLLVSYGFSTIYLLALLGFCTQGLVDIPVLVVVAALMSGTMAVFYAIFAMGMNQQVKEKNMTVPLTLCALVIMLGVNYVAPAAHIIFGPFVFLIMAYSMYRLTQKSVLLLSGVALSGSLMVIGLHYLNEGNIDLLKLELLHWFVLALTLPGFVLLTARVGHLHSALFKAGMKIKNIEEHARRDQLIGCYNRRYVDVVLEEQKRLADQTGSHLCLAVIDLDHFKRINDELGHLGGDEVLRTFAGIAQANVRQTDVFGRYGGEEFLLILPGTALLAALNTAERIRGEVENFPWESKNHRQVTVSIGLTQYIPGESVRDLFSRTDTAMYLAKRGGRNQVVVEEPIMAHDTP